MRDAIYGWIHREVLFMVTEPRDYNEEKKPDKM